MPEITFTASSELPDDVPVLLAHGGSGRLLAALNARLPLEEVCASLTRLLAQHAEDSAGTAVGPALGSAALSA